VRQARLAIAAFFVVLGITNGDWLARIPALAHGLHLSDGVLGLALLAGPAGSFAIASVAGAFLDRVGSRSPTTLAGVAVALLPTTFGLARGQAALIAGMFAFGVVAGVLDVGMNAQAVRIQRDLGRPVMTSFHASYSFGALGGGLIGGAFAWAGVGPALNFPVVGAPLAVLALAAGRRLVSDSRPVSDGGPVSESAQAGAATAPRANASAVDHRVPGGRLSPLLVLSALALCSLLSEGAADGWSAVYLRDDLRTSPGLAAVGFASFAFTMALGRLVGDRLADRFGPIRLLRAGGLLAGAGMVLAVAAAGPIGAITGFAAYGAGLSCTFPQLLSLAGNVRPDRPASAIARVAGLGYVGLLTGPVLIGGLASAAGLGPALCLPAALALCIAAGAGLAAPRALRAPRA